ncbi:Polynucleotide kinase 3 phosphatase [Sergentomyia squamirostris]
MLSPFVHLTRLPRSLISPKTMASTPVREYLLKSINGQCRDVKVTEEIKYVGRSPETEIQDEFCSRKQVMLKVDFDKRTLEIQSLGVNSSILNGQAMEKMKNYPAVHGDILEIVAGKYAYKILFSPMAGGTKHKSSDTSDDSSESPAKRAKIEAAAKESWTALDNNLLYILTTSGTISSDKVAAYDLDGTIIKTKSGNVFPKNLDDWQLAYAEVPGKLKKYHADGYKVVFFTNQAAISTKRLQIEDFRGKVQRIIAKLNIPVQVFISTGKGIYRKPMVGMWRTLEEQFNDSVKIDMTKSFFVGDAAGRPQSQSTKKDHSSADRLMALNLNLPFFTPEEHFLGKRISSWIRPEFDPKAPATPKSLLEPSGAKLCGDKQEMIVMVGSPGSGKSSFVRNNYSGQKYEVVSRDRLGTWQKCASAAATALQNGKSVIVDNTNPDMESRRRYLEVAKKAKCSCRAFVMTTTQMQARHNIAFRELIDPTHVKINEIVLNSYKSKFKEPTTAEGFSEIVRVNVLPKFEKKEHEELYKMYLLEK